MNINRLQIKLKNGIINACENSQKFMYIEN